MVHAIAFERPQLTLRQHGFELCNYVFFFNKHIIGPRFFVCGFNKLRIENSIFRPVVGTPQMWRADLSYV